MILVKPMQAPPSPEADAEHVRDLLERTDLPFAEQKALFEIDQNGGFKASDINHAQEILDALRAKELLSDAFRVRWSTLVSNHLGASQ